MELPTLKDSVEELITNIREHHPGKWYKLQAGLIQLHNISDRAHEDDKVMQQWRMLYDSIKKELPDTNTGDDMYSKAANI